MRVARCVVWLMVHLLEGHVLVDWPDGTVENRLAQSRTVERTITDVLTSWQCADFVQRNGLYEKWSKQTAFEIHILGAVQDFELVQNYTGFSSELFTYLRNLGMPLSHVRVHVFGVDSTCTLHDKEFRAMQGGLDSASQQRITVDCARVSGSDQVFFYKDALARGVFNPDVVYLSNPGMYNQPAAWYRTIRPLMERAAIFVLAAGDGSTIVNSSEGWLLQQKRVDSFCKISGGAPLAEDLPGATRDETRVLLDLNPKLMVPVFAGRGRYPAFFSPMACRK